MEDTARACETPRGLMPRGRRAPCRLTKPTVLHSPLVYLSTVPVHPWLQKECFTSPLRGGRSDRGRNVNKLRSPSSVASEAVSNIATTHAMLGTITEQLSGFHNRLASLEAPPRAPSPAPAPYVDEQRHIWSMTPPRPNYVPPPAFVKPRRPTIDPDLVPSTQLECEGLDLDAGLRHVKIDMPVMQPD
jgi:hypothetical protein